MTEEDKDLLDKDLCGRLPYMPMVEYKGENYRVLGNTHGRLVLCKPFMSYTLDECPLVEEVKPYLFPLKNVDETLRNEFYTLYDEELDYVLAEDIGATWDKSMDEFEVKEHKLKIKNLLLNSFSKILRWCYKNHIDVNGLIEKGLAKDATGLNIY